MYKIKKLYYAPGIISLIGFIFLLPYSLKRILPEKQNFLSISFPRDDEFENSAISPFSLKKILENIRNKKQLKINLTGDPNTNRNKIDLIRYEARKLKYTADTSMVIFITFSDDANYRDFIQLVDVCRTDSIRKYVPFRNHFIIYGESPVWQKIIKEKEITYFSCTYTPVTQKETQKNSFTYIRERIHPFSLKEISSIALLWIILIVLSLAKNIKRKKLFTSHFSSTP